MGVLFQRVLLLTFSLSAGLLHGEGLETLVKQFHVSCENLPAPTLPQDGASIQREESLIADWEKKLETLDYDSLDATSRIDWHLLSAELRELRADSLTRQNHSREIAPVITFGEPIQQLLRIRTRSQLPNPATSTSSLDSATAALKEIRNKLEAGKADARSPDGVHLTPLIALQAADAVDRIRADVRAWFLFYNGFQADFAGWARPACQSLSMEMAGLAEYLRKDIAGMEAPLVGQPIGADGIRTALRKEMIAYSAEELVDIASREFSWCEAEMEKAVREMGCTTRDEALGKIRNNHPTSDGRKAAVVASARESIRFLKQRNLITIPLLAENNWGVGMTGPEMRETLPYISYRKPRLMVPYSSESMAPEDKAVTLRANNLAFLHILTPHELIPGHHLQTFMADRHATYRYPFSTAFLIEGWAIHWEMLLWDQGYLDTPEERMAALFWRMHRSARVIVSLKFHLGEMSPSQMTAFLVDRVGHEPAPAAAEVRRYIGSSYDPLYQVAYTIGGLQLRALQKELTAPSPGNEGAKGTLTLREFHDRILRLGPIPIELIRASLKKKTLPKDWKPAWRFSE